MKKENRKAAQERRAKERAAEERRKKAVRVCVPVIIIAAVVVLVVGIVVSGVKASNAAKSQANSVTGSSGTVSSSTAGDTTASSLSSSASAESSSVASSSAPVLDTEAGLTAKAGDTVNIDYVGRIDGKEFDGGSTNGQGTDLTLGSGTYIDNFEEQIEGHVTGETFDVTVTFPDDYGVADLQGKTAVFTTTLNGIYR